jgi:hypothetical protein
MLYFKTYLPYKIVLPIAGYMIRMVIKRPL